MKEQLGGLIPVGFAHNAAQSDLANESRGGYRWLANTCCIPPGGHDGNPEKVNACDGKVAECRVGELQRRLVAACVGSIRVFPEVVNRPRPAVLNDGKLKSGVAEVGASAGVGPRRTFQQRNIAKPVLASQQAFQLTLCQFSVADLIAPILEEGDDSDESDRGDDE